VTLGSTQPAVNTVRAVRADNGQPAPDGTLAQVTVTAGALGTAGGEPTAIVELVNGVAQLNYFPPAEGEGTVVVRAVVAGSAGQTTLQLEQAATFFVSHVEPSSGSPQGGDQVTIVGNAFEEPVRVTFAGVNAQVLSVTDTRIRVRTPAAGNLTQPTSVAVTVQINVNEPEQDSDTISGAFTYVPGGGPIDQPAIFSVIPTNGPNEGGTPVSILGEGFQVPVQVEFCGGSVCLEAAVQNVTSSRIETLSPAATGFGSPLRNQQVDIRVRNLTSGLTATRTLAFRYGIQVLVTGITPDVVDAEDPDLVTIFGEGFEVPLQVLAGGIQQQVISVSGTEITFQPMPFPITGCPPEGSIVGSRAIQVRLLSTNVTVAAPQNLSFTAIVPRPLITGIVPNTGGPGGGTGTTISGSGFDAPVQVLFGGTAATVGAVTSTTVQATSPPPAGGLEVQACVASGGRQGTQTLPRTVDVSVENLETGCTDVLPGGFTYTPATPGCVANPQCSDGVDNDADTFIDFPADPQCSSEADNNESG
jgi:hypothetical protein